MEYVICTHKNVVENVEMKGYSKIIYNTVKTNGNSQIHLISLQKR